MCRIGHSSALCERIVAPRIDVLPYKTIATPVNKPGAQTLRELPALRPSGGAELLAVIL